MHGNALFFNPRAFQPHVVIGERRADAADLIDQHENRVIRRQQIHQRQLRQPGGGNAKELLGIGVGEAEAIVAVQHHHRHRQRGQHGGAVDRLGGRPTGDHPQRPLGEAGHAASASASSRRMVRTKPRSINGL